jgi:hypothetical protein
MKTTANNVAHEDRRGALGRMLPDLINLGILTAISMSFHFTAEKPAFIDLLVSIGFVNMVIGSFYFKRCRRSNSSKTK